MPQMHAQQNQAQRYVEPTRDVHIPVNSLTPFQHSQTGFFPVHEVLGVRRNIRLAGIPVVVEQGKEGYAVDEEKGGDGDVVEGDEAEAQRWGKERREAWMFGVWGMRGEGDGCFERYFGTRGGS